MHMIGVNYAHRKYTCHIIYSVCIYFLIHELLQSYLCAALGVGLITYREEMSAFGSPKVNLGDDSSSRQ